MRLEIPATHPIWPDRTRRAARVSKDPLLLTLKEAAELLHGEVTISALRKAGHEGRLHAIRLGKRDFTTEAALAAMLAAPTTTPRSPCQDPGRSPGSTFVQPARDDTPPTSFSTERVKSARDAALMIAERLKRRSGLIKSPDTNRKEVSRAEGVRGTRPAAVCRLDWPRYRADRSSGEWHIATVRDSVINDRSRGVEPRPTARNGTLRNRSGDVAMLSAAP